MKTLQMIILLASFGALQGCVHKLVTVPVAIAYDVTKGVAKGTVAVGKAIIPGGNEDDKEDKEDKDD